MKELDDVTEELNENLRRAEALLVSRARVAAEVWLSTEKRLRLRFGKHDGNWGLFVLDGADVPWHLKNVSRKTRVMAAHKLEDLAQAIEEASETSIEEVDGAVDAVEAFLLKRKS